MDGSISLFIGHARWHLVLSLLLRVSQSVSEGLDRDMIVIGHCLDRSLNNYLLSLNLLVCNIEMVIVDHVSHDLH